MRIVVDAAAAGDNSVGVCVEGWVRGWSAVAGTDDDVLHVVTSQSFADQAGMAGLPHVVVYPFGPGVRSRIRAQHVTVPRLISHVGADVLLAVVPQIPLVPGRVPTVVVSYDFRHELLPAEFTRARRAVRRIEYLRAYRRADRIVTISERTRTDLGRLHPQWHAKSATVHLGSDRRPRRFVAPPPDRPIAVAYAQHVNKRPQLVLRAWAVASARGEPVPALAVIGAPAPLALELEALRAELGLSPDSVSVQSSLSDDDYTDLLARARLVVLASTFEGFGLPVVEALRLGVPVAITPEPAMIEVGGPAATVAADDTPEALATAVITALAEDTDERRQAGIEWAAQFNWAASATALRRELVRATTR